MQALGQYGQPLTPTYAPPAPPASSYEDMMVRARQRWLATHPGQPLPPELGGDPNGPSQEEIQSGQMPSPSFSPPQPNVWNAAMGGEPPANARLQSIRSAGATPAPPGGSAKTDDHPAVALLKAQSKSINAQADLLKKKMELDASAPAPSPAPPALSPPQGDAMGQFNFSGPPQTQQPPPPQGQPQAAPPSLAYRAAPDPAPAPPMGSAYMPSRGAYGPQPNNMPGAGPSQPAAAWLPPNDPGVNHAQSIGPAAAPPSPLPPQGAAKLALNDQDIQDQFAADSAAAGLPQVYNPAMAPPPLFDQRYNSVQSFGSQGFVAGRLPTPTPAPEMMGGGASAAAGGGIDAYAAAERKRVFDMIEGYKKIAENDDGVAWQVKVAREKGATPAQLAVIHDQAVDEKVKQLMSEGDKAENAGERAHYNYPYTPQGQAEGDAREQRRSDQIEARQIKVAASRIESARAAADKARYESEGDALQASEAFNAMAEADGSQWRRFPKPPTSQTGLWTISETKYVPDEKKVSPSEQQAESANENAKTALAATFDDGGFKNTKGVVQKWDKPSGYSSAYSQMVLKMKGQPDRRVLALLDSPKSYVNEDASLGLTPEAKTAFDQMTKQASRSAGTSGNSDLDSLALGKANGALRFKNNQ